MDCKHYIWVNITGGVMGFDPREIADFEVVFDISLKPHGADYWDAFNYHFDDLLDGKEATGFSVLWHDEQAWRHLHHLWSIR